MKTSLIGLFGAAIFCLSLTQASESICDTPTTLKQIDAFAASPKNSFTNTLFQIAIQNKRIVLVGDEHFNTSTFWMKDLIKRFRQVRGSHVCVAFEFPNVTPTADQYVLKHQKDYHDVLVQIEKMRNPKISSADKVRLDAAEKQAETESAQFYNYFRPLTEYAASNGIKNFAVDSPDKEEGEIPMFERNAAMAQNLVKLLKSNVCSDILMYVGKEHLVPNGTPKEVSLIFYLTTFFRDYSFVTINLQMTQETIAPQGRTWNKCSAPQIAQPIIFPSSILQGNAAVMQADDNSPLLRDFDYTILLP